MAKKKQGGQPTTEQQKTLQVLRTIHARLVQAREVAQTLCDEMDAILDKEHTTIDALLARRSEWVSYAQEIEDLVTSTEDLET